MFQCPWGAKGAGDYQRLHSLQQVFEKKTGTHSLSLKHPAKSHPHTHPNWPRNFFRQSLDFTHPPPRERFRILRCAASLISISPFNEAGFRILCAVLALISTSPHFIPLPFIPMPVQPLIPMNNFEPVTLTCHFDGFTARSKCDKSVAYWSHADRLPETSWSSNCW